ncbi:MAG: EamA family transporter, partial [Actinomycetota bacterium]
MIAVALAAVSALSYGASDFTGAVASKKNDATVVTVAVQAVSLVALGAIILAFPSGRLIGVDLAWGALGGLGTAIGLVMFYKALALGPMSVAAALTALWSSAIPVVTGLALGDRPGAVTL